MELKQYQKKVISDLTRFLALLTEKQNISQAYSALWTEKNVPVGLDGMPAYRTVIPGVPSVCMVYDQKQPDYPGAYSLERFMEIVKGL